MMSYTSRYCCAPRALTYESVRSLKRVKAIGVGLAQIDLAAAGGEQVDHGLGRSAGVRYPDALGQPQAPQPATTRPASGSRPA